MLLTSILVGAILNGCTTAMAIETTDPEPGQLAIIGKDGQPTEQLCPLKGTRVHADISGFGARVVVVQTFRNPSKEAIEAVYTFPLPNDAAVDRMRMKVGDRIIEGEIKRREEARVIYDQAKAAGQTASLLDQERPNIFTQSIANIMPGTTVEIEISYVQLLKYENGQFEFSYPMVVGPRYLGNAKDPGKIAPPITPKGTRTGANIELSINLDAGAPIQEMKSVLHEITSAARGQGRAEVTLKRKDEIPNKDFILRYRVATDSVQNAFITHMDGDKGGFFTLIMMPPKQPAPSQIAPKEVVFVVDQSGSQSGFPIEKSKELTLKLMKTLGPNDSFNVIGFSNNVNHLWSHSMPNSEFNMKEAERFVSGLDANGGTELRKAVVAAYNLPKDGDKLRIVLFNTDGFVGDEREILDTIQKQRQDTRMFVFGIGNGVNRYLIDAMAEEGKGDAEYVTLAESADGAVQRFIERTKSPVLTNIQVSVEGGRVEEIMPSNIPDVFAGKPVMITGRYNTTGPGKVTVSGRVGGQPWSQTLDVQFANTSNAPALMSLWARRKVDDLTRENYLSIYQLGTRTNDVNERITQLALDYHLMTEFTSFVAVEKKVVNIGGKQRTVQVPVEMTDGVSYEGIFGREAEAMAAAPASKMAYASPQMSTGGGFGGGRGVASGQPMRYKANAKHSVVSPDYEKQMKPEDRKQARFERKVAASLKKATGKVDVQIFLEKLTPETLEALKKLGLHVDDKDAGLKVVFGSVDAAALKAIADLDAVTKIEPL
jgi:Ca-activated chloride channel family protein